MTLIKKLQFMVLVEFHIFQIIIVTIQNLGYYNTDDNINSFPLTGDYAKPELFGLEGILNIYK